MGAYKASDFEIWDKPAYFYDEGFGFRGLGSPAESVAEHAQIITTKALQASPDNICIYSHNLIRLKRDAYYLHIFLDAISSDLRRYEKGDKARLKMARYAAGHAINIIDKIKEKSQNV